MGQQVFLHADDVHVREFQTLGRMQGHQLHAVVFCVLFFLLLQQIPEHKATDCLIQRYLFFLHHALETVDEEIHVGHAALGNLFRRADLVQPVGVADIRAEPQE